MPVDEMRVVMLDGGVEGVRAGVDASDSARSEATIKVLLVIAICSTRSSLRFSLASHLSLSLQARWVWNIFMALERSPVQVFMKFLGG